MAIVTVPSDVLAATPVGTTNTPANRAGAALGCTRFRVPALQAVADIGSTIRVCTLPNNARYLAALSKVSATAAGAGATLSLGYEAYKGAYGEVVPANPTALGSGLSVAAATSPFLDTMVGGPGEWEAPADVVLIFTNAGAVLPVGWELEGTIVWASAFIGLP
jgi:hypothetical protein